MRACGCTHKDVELLHGVDTLSTVSSSDAFLPSKVGWFVVLPIAAQSSFLHVSCFLLCAVSNHFLKRVTSLLTGMANQHDIKWRKMNRRYLFFCLVLVLCFL